MPPRRKRKKKKLLGKILITVFAIVIIVSAISILYKYLQYRKAKYTRYPEFGIAIPSGYVIHGIDVSRYQDIIAWEEVKAMIARDINLEFAFIKATEGISNTDAQFKRNWKKARESGLVRGAYHFFIASKDGRLQAENFIDKVKIEPGDLPPVLDVEQLNGTSYLQIRQEVKEWLAIVENHYHARPIIYTNVEFYSRVLGSEFDAYPLWVAHYYEPEKPRIKRDWIFWQHSDEGRVNGITAKVDFNVFNGDSLAFRQFLVQ
jgi:lysozyme